MVNNILKNLGMILLPIMLLSTQCKKDKHDDEFDIKKTPFVGNKLRTDGYYYYTSSYGYYDIYFLYRDGTILYGEDVDFADINQYEEQYRNGVFYQRAKNDLNYWGPFLIEGNNIKYEFRGGGDGSGLLVFKYEGSIINDTTFEITHSIRVNGENSSTLNDTYHFKKFSPKPDSTNSFVK